MVSAQSVFWYHVDMSDVDEYLKTATESQKAFFKKFKEIVKQVVPDAEESISYGIPTFKYKKKPLIYWGAFSTHMSIFPASDSMVLELGEALGKFRVSKGTLRFTEAKPIPESLLKEIVKHRLKIISEK